jgi:hypothetical protein
LLFVLEPLEPLQRLEPLEHLQIYLWLLMIKPDGTVNIRHRLAPISHRVI